MDGDLTDLATVHIAANITSPVAGTDAILATLISAISAYVPQVLDRNILADNYLETYEGNGKSSLLLRQRPVLQVSFVEWQGQKVSVQADPINGPNGVFTDGRSAMLFGSTFPQGSLVRVGYSAGYMNVPADLSLAVAELVAEAYAARTHVGETSRSQQNQITTAFEPKAMHNRIADKLRSYRHGAPC